jgi:hypothetical protein
LEGKEGSAVKLRLDEMETLIRWNEEENFAVIWTASPKVQARLARMGLEPSRREGDEAWYEAPKGAVLLKPGRLAVPLAGRRNDLQAFLRGEWAPRPAEGKLKGREGGLTLYEQETFINWDEKDPEAEIYTASPRVQARLEKAGLRPARKDAWALVYRVPRGAMRLKLKVSVRIAGGYRSPSRSGERPSQDVA